MFPAETELAFHQEKKMPIDCLLMSMSWITLFSLAAYVGCQLQKDIMTWDMIWYNMMRCNAIHYKTVQYDTI